MPATGYRKLKGPNRPMLVIPYHKLRTYDGAWDGAGVPFTGLADTKLSTPLVSNQKVRRGGSPIL